MLHVEVPELGKAAEGKYLKPGVANEVLLNIKMLQIV